MKVVLHTIFGSHLYGTETPASDIDTKTIVVPDARDILLQRAKGVLTTPRPKGEGEKNVAGEADEVMISLQRYLALVAEGQTMAMDILFAPPWLAEITSPIWSEIFANRHRLVTKRIDKITAYVLAQSGKYGVKGSRVAAVRSALDHLEAWCAAGYAKTRLRQCEAAIHKLVDSIEHMWIVKVGTNKGQDLYWEVCGRKLPFSATVENAHAIMAKMMTSYGHRSLLAEQQHGVDWKALSHAVRTATQSLELLATGHVTFPRPDARHIMQIKAGHIRYQDVAAEIETLIDQVKAAVSISTLPENPDLEWIDDFVAKVYRDAIVG